MLLFKCLKTGLYLLKVRGVCSVSCLPTVIHSWKLSLSASPKEGDNSALTVGWLDLEGFKGEFLFDFFFFVSTCLMDHSGSKIFPVFKYFLGLTGSMRLPVFLFPCLYGSLLRSKMLEIHALMLSAAAFHHFHALGRGQNLSCFSIPQKKKY